MLSTKSSRLGVQLSTRRSSESVGIASPYLYDINNSSERERGSLVSPFFSRWRYTSRKWTNSNLTDWMTWVTSYLISSFFFSASCLSLCAEIEVAKWGDWSAFVYAYLHNTHAHVYWMVVWLFFYLQQKETYQPSIGAYVEHSTKYQKCIVIKGRRRKSVSFS